jgi:hypothetical protein
MSNTNEVVVERLPVEDAFELVAHETRLDILEVLNAAARPLAFGELRERVGVEDPGGFNYHLGKLVGRLVQNEDAGYELAEPGHRIVGGVLSGGFTKALNADPVSVDGTCSECSAPLEARFHDNGIRVVCQECGFEYTDPQIPAGALEGVSRENAPAIVEQWLKRVHAAAEYGFCYNCDGRLNQDVVVPTDESAPEWLTGDELDATIIYNCERCGRGWQSILPFAILNHPAVVAFHYEHGIDLRKTPEWSLGWLRAGLARVVNEVPLTIELPITLDNETYIFTIDRDLDIIHQRPA